MVFPNDDRWQAFYETRLVISCAGNYEVVLEFVKSWMAYVITVNEDCMLQSASWVLADRNIDGIKGI